MQNKLIEEGVVVKNNKVLNFEEYLWINKRFNTIVLNKLSVYL